MTDFDSQGFDPDESWLDELSRLPLQQPRQELRSEIFLNPRAGFFQRKKRDKLDWFCRMAAMLFLVLWGVSPVFQQPKRPIFFYIENSILIRDPALTQNRLIDFYLKDFYENL